MSAVVPPVIVVVAVRVIPNDLARGVDAFRNSAAGGEWIVKSVAGQGIVEGGVGAAAGIVEEPVGGVAGEVSSNDQPRAVDPLRLAAVAGQRNGESVVGAAGGIEAIAVVANVLVTVGVDDVVGIVDAAWVDVADVDRGTVEGCGSINGHDTAPLRW